LLHVWAAATGGFGGGKVRQCPSKMTCPYKFELTVVVNEIPIAAFKAKCSKCVSLLCTLLHHPKAFLIRPSPKSFS